MGQHARRVAGGTRDANHGGLLEAVVRHDDAGGMGDLLAAFVMVHGLGHGSLLHSRTNVTARFRRDR